MIDTLKLANKLEAAGFTAQQAQGQATALAEFLDQSAATKADLENATTQLRLEIEKAKADVIRWVASMGVIQTVIVALLLKYLR